MCKEHPLVRLHNLKRLPFQTFEHPEIFNVSQPTALPSYYGLAHFRKGWSVMIQKRMEDMRFCPQINMTYISDGKICT